MKSRVGLIGFGYWGQKLARNLHYRCTQEESDLVFVAVADKSQHKRQLALSSYPYIQIYSSYEEMMGKVKLDALVIATPALSHADLTLRTLVAGCDVLVEKPMAMDYIKAVEINHTAKVLGLSVVVDHTLCHSRNILALKWLLANKLAPSHITTVRLNVAPNQKELSDCNVLWDLASHDLAVIDYLSPRTKAKSVCALGTDTSIALTVNYPDNLTASVVVSWEGPTRRRDLIVTGIDYCIIYDGITDTLSQQPTSYPGFMHDEPLQNLIIDFEKSIAGDISRSNSAQGVRVVEILDAAHRSLNAKGKTIYL